MRSCSSKGKKQCTLMKILMAPIWVLCKATDFYIKCMNDCAGKMGTGAAGGAVFCPVSHVGSMPKTFSVNSSRAAAEEEDVRQLLRTVSKRRDNMAYDEVMDKQKKGKRKLCRKSSDDDDDGAGGGMKRNYSVGVGKIGRINEDEPCSFEEELLFSKNKNSVMGFYY